MPSRSIPNERARSGMRALLLTVRCCQPCWSGGASLLQLGRLNRSEFYDALNWGRARFPKWQVTPGKQWKPSSKIKPQKMQIEATN